MYKGVLLMKFISIDNIENNSRIKEFFKNELKISNINEVYTYYKEESNKLCIVVKNGKIVGLIGISIVKNKIIIKHIAVEKNMQRTRLGENIVKKLLIDYPSFYIEAETDKDSVGFYRYLDFQITSLGEKYPGVTRYKCILKPS